MRIIQELVEMIDDEICGAKVYAEMYLDMKSKNSGTWANKFKAMANEELVHATNIHDYAMEEINRISKVYTPPVEMQEKWDISHKSYVERVAWVKMMLNM